MIYKRWIYLGGVALCALFLAGCVEPPRVMAPSVAHLPEAFSTQGTVSLPQKWWESLNDPQLNTVMEEALAGNLTIRMAWDRLRQAEALADQATSFLLPSLTYSGMGRRTRRDTNNTTTSASDYRLGLGASYEIDLWGRARSAYDATLLDAQARQEDMASAAMTVSASVAKLWYQLAETKQTLAVMQQQLETNRRVYKLVLLHFRNSKVGVGAPDVLRQKQLVESTQGQLIQARERQVLLQHALAVLLGKPAGQWDPPEAMLIELPVLPAVGVPSEVLQRRPDVRSVWLAVQSADARVAIAITDKYPSLSLSANVDTTSTHMKDLFDDWLASLAANVAGPLFDAGRRQAEVERTRAVVSQLLNQYGQTVLEALQDVEDALVREQQQTRYLASLQSQLTLARAVTQKTEKRYKLGAADYLRILDALRTEQQLEIGELAAQRLLLDHRIDLCRSIAGSWDMERPDRESIDQH
jgi:NodT family efflux transporter outer membrane factor (OMF) lipoprotein